MVGGSYGQKVTVTREGEVFLANLVHASTREPVRRILDWIDLSMRIARQAECHEAGRSA